MSIFKGFLSRLDTGKERIIELEDRSITDAQVKAYREKKVKIKTKTEQSKSCETLKQHTTCSWKPKTREQGRRNI